jgi:hypothetical protein
MPFISEDRNVVTVTFSNFEAEAGPGIAVTQNRKTCTLTLGVQ